MRLIILVISILEAFAAGCMHENGFGKALSSGIVVSLSISEAPALNQIVELTLSMTAPRDAPNVSAKIILPDGLELVRGSPSWSGKLTGKQTVKFHCLVKAIRTGEWTIIGAVTGGNDYLYLLVLEEKGLVRKSPFPN